MKDVRIESGLSKLNQCQIAAEACNNTSSDIQDFKATKICMVDVFDSPIKVVDPLNYDNKIMYMMMNMNLSN